MTSVTMDFLTIRIETLSNGEPVLGYQTLDASGTAHADLEQLMALNRLLLQLAADRARWDQPPRLAAPSGSLINPRSVPSAPWPPGTMHGRMEFPGALQLPKERVADARTEGLSWPPPDLTWPTAKRAGWNAYFAREGYSLPSSRGDLRDLWNEGHDAGAQSYPNWHDVARP